MPGVLPVVDDAAGEFWLSAYPPALLPKTAELSPLPPTPAPISSSQLVTSMTSQSIKLIFSNRPISIHSSTSPTMGKSNITFRNSSSFNLSFFSVATVGAPCKFCTPCLTFPPSRGRFSNCCRNSIRPSGVGTRQLNDSDSRLGEKNIADI